MPYINKQYRDELNFSLEELIDSVEDLIEDHSLEDRQITGVANYLVTVLLLRVLKPEYGWNYDALANVHKTLDCANKEIYRRLTSVYEDSAIRKNGDIKELNELNIGGNHNAG